MALPRPVSDQESRTGNAPVRRGHAQRQVRCLSYPNYADLRDRSRTLQALAAHGYTDASVGLGAGAEDTTGEVVTGNYFNLLGVNAALGRTLLPGDDLTPGAHPVVVISHAFWQSRLGVDKNAVGRKYHNSGADYSYTYRCSCA
jgi:putative ABC transport system permease protein